MFIGWNEKPSSIPVGNVCYFARFYIKSLWDLGNLTYSAYKHIFPPGIFWWRMDSCQKLESVNNRLQSTALLATIPLLLPKPLPQFRYQ